MNGILLHIPDKAMKRVGVGERVGVRVGVRERVGESDSEQTHTNPLTPLHQGTYE